MDDQRYNVLPSDDKRRGVWMVVRETIRDLDHRAIRDRDFSPEYFEAHEHAANRQDVLNAELLKWQNAALLSMD